MTPKEKAKELWSDFLGCLIRTSNTYIDNGFIEEQAKQCALIAIDQVLNELDELLELPEQQQDSVYMSWLYYKDVKEEINKL